MKADEQTLATAKLCLEMAALLTKAAQDIEGALQARDLAQENRDMQLRNTLAFKTEADRRLAILRAILHADERGQGLPFAEALERARLEVSDP